MKCLLKYYFYNDHSQYKILKAFFYCLQVTSGQNRMDLLSLLQENKIK